MIPSGLIVFRGADVDLDKLEEKRFSAFIAVFAACSTIIVVKCKLLPTVAYFFLDKNKLTLIVVISYFLIYRQYKFQFLAQKYRAISKRQYVLVKENVTENLIGEEANPAKSEYQANIDEIRLLKKEFFKVSVKLFPIQFFEFSTYRLKPQLSC